VGGVGEPDRPGDAAELLTDQRVHELVAAEPAPRLVDGDAHHVQFGQLVEYLGGEAVLVLYLLCHRLDFVLAELPY